MSAGSVCRCSDCCNRYYRSVGVIVICLVLKQLDCMSVIVEASRSIFARDGLALLKAVTIWQRESITPGVGTLQAVVVCWVCACVVCVPL